MKPLYIYLAVLAVMSLVDLILYRVDETKAQKGKWRIKESTLLLTGVFGGAIGALLGMKLFRHKTKHWYFWAVNILALAAQLFLLYLLIK